MPHMHYFNLTRTVEGDRFFYYPHFIDRKLRFQEVRSLAQGHTPALCWAMEMDTEDSDISTASLWSKRVSH